MHHKKAKANTFAFFYLCIPDGFSTMGSLPMALFNAARAAAMYNDHQQTACHGDIFHEVDHLVLSGIGRLMPEIMEKYRCGYSEQ